MRAIAEWVRAGLMRDSYDGLSNDSLGCACLVGDLAPCGELTEDCSPGHRVDGCNDDCGEGCDFHVE